MNTLLLEFGRLPESILDEEELEEFISRPTQELIDDMSALDGDIIILGVGGKVGPCLARMAKRAAPHKRILGVARFTNSNIRTRLESWGIETLSCDLLDREAVHSLPKFANVIYMAGRKFGTSGDEAFSWAMNTHVPGIVAEAYRESRIIVFSTLCVYPYSDVIELTCDEDTPPNPIGEYANSCVGRERIFQYFSEKFRTEGRIIRLNYAIDLRYGVLFDVANWVNRGEPIDLTTGHASVIWHGDVNNQVLRSFSRCETPMAPLNIGGVKPTSIRKLAHMFSDRLGKEPKFLAKESANAWVNRTDKALNHFGHPVVDLEHMVDWVANWVQRDMPNYGNPTKYEVRHGGF